MCAINDIRYSTLNEQYKSNLTVEDLDYNKWLDFLEEECSFDFDRHTLQYKTGEDTLRIKSKWSWRAAIQEMYLNTNSSRIIFDMI